MNSKVHYAVAAILGGAALATQYAAAAEAAAGPENTGALEEITVTAQRRSQNMQDVPISMQAFTGAALQQLNVTTFDDYIKYLPNVSSANNGPGQNEVFMRGLSGGSQATQGSGSTAPWPNVAIYLDNQSGQLPGRNLDIYAVDLDRIEVLEGPQGTLFGAGAEAGVIRYITNQPKLDVTEGNVKASYGTTAHGDPNTEVSAVLNLPLVAGHAAIRAVIYNDRRGGYIDNVPGTFHRNNTDIGIHYAYYPAVNGQCPDGKPNTGWCVPPGSPSANNYNIAHSNINPATYQGVRAELLYKFNDDWDFLLSQSYQTLNTEGVFYQMPHASDGAALQPLQVTLFNNTYDKDKFESTSWTLNGRLPYDLRLVYTGGYLVRNVEQVGDYTNYSRGVYADYYQCYGPGSDPALKSTCFSPAVIWRSYEQNKHQQHEIRISTPDDWRARGIVGAYWEDNKLWDQSDWRYKTVPSCTSNVPGSPGDTGCFSNIGTAPGTSVATPGLRDSNSSFYQDDMREVKQTAFFFSADYDIIPKVLTVTAGTRHFKFDNSLTGAVNASFYCFEQGVPAGGCQGSVYNLDQANLKDTESGWKSRANLTWHVMPDLMVYYTFSQGFRPGSFNQNGGTEHGTDINGNYQYVVPRSYSSDKLTNNEVGWKSEFFGHRLQWNGAIYRESWDNVQISLFNSGVTGNVFYNTNGQNFLIKGVETSLLARPITGLTVQGAAAWNQSRQTNQPALLINDPTNPNYGKVLNQVCLVAGDPTSCYGVPNPFGPIGAPSANAPPFQFSLRARYDWEWNGYAPFAQIGMAHVGHQFTQAGGSPSIQPGGAIGTSRGRFEVPAYTTYDAAIGVGKDPWMVMLNVENLSDSNAATFITTGQFTVAQTPLRPRVITLSANYKF